MGDKDEDEVGLVVGAKPLARFIFGDESKYRSIYQMSDEEKRELGLFYRDKLICGLKSEIRKRIAAMAAGQV